MKQGSIRGVLKKHGFFQEATGDGGDFHAHDYPMPESVITLHHSRMSAWMEPDEPTAIDHAVFYDKKKKQGIVIGEVPPPGFVGDQRAGGDIFQRRQVSIRLADFVMKAVSKCRGSLTLNFPRQTSSGSALRPFLLPHVPRFPRFLKKYLLFSPHSFRDF